MSSVASQATNRLGTYKNNSKEIQDFRKRREEERVQLRKLKRDEQVFKRRNVEAPDADEMEVDAQHLLTHSKVVIDPEIIKALYSEQIEEQEAAVKRLRQLICREPEPIIDVVIQAGIIPRLVEYLHMDNRWSLQLEAAWALTNIASGTSQQTQMVINAGAVPVFIRLLSSPIEDIQDQAVWALGNIAGDGPESRDYVLDAGILPILLPLFCQSECVKIIRRAVWCLSNLCRDRNPSPDFSKVSQALPVLARLLYHSDEEILADACWALSYLCRENIQAVIDSGVCPKLVELLTHNHDSVIAAALRVIGNLVTGDDYQIQVMINCSVLPSLLQLLDCNKESVCKEACWVISNITAGNPNRIQNVIDSNIIPGLVNNIEKLDFNTRKEAVWAIANAISGGLPQQIRYMVSENCIPPLCDLLTLKDNEVVQLALCSLENILRVGESDAKLDSEDNVYALVIKQCGGLDKIEYIQDSENHEICKKANAITEHYFGIEEEYDQSMMPQISEESRQYQFGGLTRDSFEHFQF